jgi:anthranilate synthase component I
MEISELRKKIDSLDKNIFELIKERLSIVEEIVHIKKKNQRSIFDADREKLLLEEKQKLAQEFGISEHTVEEIFRAIIAESHLLEKRLYKTDETSPRKLRRKIISTPLSLGEIFERIAESHSHFFFLESLGEDEWSEVSLIGFSPAKVFAAKGGEVFIDEQKTSTNKNPLQWLEEEFSPYQHLVNPESAKGFSGGLVGHFSYEAFQYLENLPLVSHPDFYDFEFGLYFDGLIYDRKRETLEYFTIDEDRSKQIHNLLQKSISARKPFSATPGGSNFSDETIESAIEECKKEIVAGNVFQIVPSRKFYYEINGDLVGFYARLRETNPSPNMFFLSFGERKLIGSSPEMVAKVEDRHIETYPIAGTRSRGKTPKEDALEAASLLSDEKELAEHLMLVDMARNDLGKVCEYSSVQVSSLMALKKYSHVQHLVSTVSGKRKAEISSLRAALSNFPMGTVCGAPRIEAVKILAQIEKKDPRGPYSGAVGFWSVSGDTTLALAIRSLFISGEKAFSQAGAGIVCDSLPKNERKEIEKKSRNIRDLLEE